MTDVASVAVVPRDHGETDLILAGCFEREAPDVEGAAPEVRSALERLAARGGWGQPAGATGFGVASAVAWARRRAASS